MAERVGFIGLGAMGSPMAARVAGQFETWVYDLRKEAIAHLTNRGAGGDVRAAKNVTEIAPNCNWILLSLPDAEAVERVIFGSDGLEPALRAGQVVVDCGTTHPKRTRAVAASLATLGVDYLDAPVSGMPQGAREGALTVMVGGRRDVFARLQPVLQTFGREIVHMGESGAGQVAKTVNNVLYNIACAAMAEMLPLATALGLAPEAVARVVSAGTGQSFAFDYFAGRVVRRVFDEGFPMSSGLKDMATMAEMAEALGVSPPVFNGAMETYRMALDQGLGPESKGAMAKVWERTLGVEVGQAAR